MSYNLLVAFGLEEAKKLNPSFGDLIILGGFDPTITEDWKDCEGSSIPEELCHLKEQNIILVKITRDKIKFFKFPEKKSLCLTETYNQALKKLE